MSLSHSRVCSYFYYRHGRFQLTGTKEIKKVAEARARKRKRAVAKLNAAKKLATVQAENSELSEGQKLNVTNVVDI